MKKLKIVFIAASIALSAITNVFASEARIIDATIKISQGEGGGPCSSGYIIEGNDFNTNVAVTSCAKVVSKINLGPVLAYQVGKLKKAERKKYNANPLEYFSRQGEMRFSGEDVEGDIEFIITSVEII